MDETYIKMCDCPEIQGQKPQWLDGEFVALRGVDTKAEQAGEWLMHTDDRFVWCPMQHQLQEMVDWKRMRIIMEWSCVTHQFTWWADYPLCITAISADSLEQAWLMLAMKEIHNKTWDGETWTGGNDAE